MRKFLSVSLSQRRKLFALPPEQHKQRRDENERYSEGDQHAARRRLAGDRDPPEGRHGVDVQAARGDGDRRQAVALQGGIGWSRRLQRLRHRGGNHGLGPCGRRPPLASPSEDRR